MIISISKECAFKCNPNVYLFHLSCSTLPGNGITGEIPEEFGNLMSLTKLDLSNNSLTGDIPSSLGMLKKLQFL